MQCNMLWVQGRYWDLGRPWVWNPWSVVNLWTYHSDLMNKNWNDEIIFNSNWEVILDISWELDFHFLGEQTLLLQDIDPVMVVTCADININMGICINFSNMNCLWSVTRKITMQSFLVLLLLSSTVNHIFDQVCCYSSLSSQHHGSF